MGKIDTFKMAGMREGKFTEYALLGKAKPIKSDLPYNEAFENGKMVSLVRKNMDQVLQECRDAQTDDPEWPKKPFMRRVLNDVETKLTAKLGLDELPSNLTLRIYTALETPLDVCNVDFWVELHDEDSGRVIGDFKIDLKTHPHGEPSRLAEYVYFYDTKLDDLDDREAMYRTTDYRDLVEQTANHIAESREVQRVRHALERTMDLGETGDFS